MKRRYLKAISTGQWKKCFFFSFTIIVFIFFYIQGKNSARNTDNYVPTYVNLLKLKTAIVKAIRYSRTVYIRHELERSLKITEKSIEHYKLLNEKNFNSEKSLKLSDIKLISHLITLIIYFDSCSDAQKFVLESNFEKISVVIFGNYHCAIKTDNKVIFIKEQLNIKGLAMVTSYVKTKYVLVGRNMKHIQINQKDILQLIKLGEIYNFAYVAGAWRTKLSAQLGYGCHQFNMKLYTLVVSSGYDVSYKSCVLCDYSSAPFIVNKQRLLRDLTDLHYSKVRGWPVFLELFINIYQKRMKNSLTNQILVCPNYTFHSSSKNQEIENRKIERSDLITLASNLKIDRFIIEPHLVLKERKKESRVEYKFSCGEVGMKCTKTIGIGVPNCCLAELSDAFRFMKHIIEDKANSTFEIIEGTVMGSIKYGSILLWERDGDSNFWAYHTERVEKLIGQIKKAGYSMVLSWECPFKQDWEKCRHAGYHGSSYYDYKMRNWRIQMYGVTYLLSPFRGNLTYPTQVKLDDTWYTTYTNPVLYARNIYGGEILQHQEHAASRGLPIITYYTKQHLPFRKCPQPHFHSCLDQFFLDGGRQFIRIFL